MPEAIVDTTILTDVLLQSGPPKDDALAAISRYTKTSLPVYAILEFRSGPLHNFAWMHNQLALSSLSVAFDKLHKMSRTPRRYTVSTALQALQNAQGSIANLTLHELTEKYGSRATQDQAMADELRIAIKTKIFRAWDQRRSITTDVVAELRCFQEQKPNIKRNLIDLKPLKCNLSNTCEMAKLLLASPSKLKILKTAVDASPSKLENTKRSKILKHLIRTPKRPIDRNQCRNLGDAVFAFLAPPGADILTTNRIDHDPLAKSLGNSVATP